MVHAFEKELEDSRLLRFQGSKRLDGSDAAILELVDRHHPGEGRGVFGQTDLAQRPTGLDADHRIVGVFDASKDGLAGAVIAQVSEASDDGRANGDGLVPVFELGHHDLHGLILLDLVFVERRRAELGIGDVPDVGVGVLAGLTHEALVSGADVRGTSAAGARQQRHAATRMSLRLRDPETDTPSMTRCPCTWGERKRERAAPPCGNARLTENMGSSGGSAENGRWPEARRKCVPWKRAAS